MFRWDGYIGRSEYFFSCSVKINWLGFELFRNITTFAALKMRVIQFLKEI